MFKTFNQFLLENVELSDLHKVYITINPESGHRWWTYKGFAGSNFFQQLTPENYQEVDINPNYPVLNYNSEMTNRLLEEGLIQEKMIYNHPESIKDSGSKVNFHRIVDEDPNIPTTVFTKNEAKDLLFPIIAKPAAGHSGIGIQIFKTVEELESAKGKFDLFSEFVDKKEEHRFFLFNGMPFFWMQREPLNNKAKSGDGDSKEEMNFKYIKKDVNSLGQDYRDLLTRFASKFPKIPFICFDVMKSKADKLFIIESNSQPGVPYDSTVELYYRVFQDAFKREINEQGKKELKKFAKFLDKKTLQLDPERFEIQKN